MSDSQLQPQNDHDLLIVIATRLENLTKTVDGRVERLETDTSKLNDRVSAQDKKIYIGLGALIALKALLGLFTGIHLPF